jgi:hypothetical protein
MNAAKNLLLLLPWTQSDYSYHPTPTKVKKKVVFAPSDRACALVLSKSTQEHVTFRWFGFKQGTVGNAG